MADDQIHRVRQFLDAAKVLRDPVHPLGQLAREKLPAATGLSRENVDWALMNALEIDASDDELRRLCNRTPTCSRAHVLLSANVFVAALRAVAIGIASAPVVCVRPSRREALMAELLLLAAPGQFQRVDAITPAPGEHCWAYGKNETLAALRQSWPKGVTLHGHGHGYGVAILGVSDWRDPGALQAIATALSVDIAAFDQRGCLSPRIVLVEQGQPVVQHLANALAAAMATREAAIPIGALSYAERAEVQRYRATLRMVGHSVEAGHGLVTFEVQPLPRILPPVGRVIHLRTVADAIDDLSAYSDEVTTVGVTPANLGLAARLAAALPNTRLAELGKMQTPRLDGPVDFRSGRGQIL